jgi:carboxyl-terminal processing protease
MRNYYKTLLFTAALVAGYVVTITYRLDDRGGTSISGDTEAHAGTWDPSEVRILSKVALYVNDQYVDPDRIEPRKMFIAACEELQSSFAEVLVTVDDAKNTLTMTVDTAKKTVSLAKLDTVFDVSDHLGEILKFVNEHHTSDLKPVEIEYAAANGMLSTLDPHSVLLRPELFTEMTISTKGKFGGLGIVISIRDGKLTVITPMKGTPAYAAGLKPFDNIVKIGDESTVSMDLDEAVSKLRGDPGTPVSISVMRKDWTEPKDFTIVREEIEIDSVEHKALEGGIGYLLIKSFQGTTLKDLRAALEDLKASGATKGIILDLRNNPGGLLDQAVKVVDEFVKTGTIVSTVEAGNVIKERKEAKDSKSEVTVPVVVILNGGSASASEIVAGALKNLNRALVIGTTSFGKGSVQVLYDDFPDGAALKLTVAQYLTPGDISIQSVGVTPDVMMLPASIETGGVVLYTSESHLREEDLESHLTNEEKAKKGMIPRVRIPYFYSKVEMEHDDKLREDDPDAFIEDHEIAFAKELLKAADKSWKRSDFLDAKGLAVIDKLGLKEMDKINTALASLGVDWSPAPPGAAKPPAPTAAPGSAALGTAPAMAVAPAAPPLMDVVIASARKDKDGKMVPAKSVTAGESVTITATVTNRGTAPAWRLHATTKSDYGLLKDREFVFGKIMPGESRSSTVEVKVPRDARSRMDVMRLEFDADAGTPPAPIETEFLVEGLPRPEFAYATRVVDTEGGNGDGLLQVGENVKLVVTIKNIGAGKAYDAVAMLKNHSGKSIFIKTGRIDLVDEKVDGAGILPGEVRTLEFNFQVAAAPPDGKDYYELQLGVADGVLHEYAGDKFKIPVGPAGTKAPAATDVLLSVTAATASVYGGASDTASPIIAALGKGSVLHATARAGDFWRVDAVDGLPAGWVRASDVATASGGAPKAVKGGLVMANAPPTIAVTLPGLTVPGATVKLTGTASDDTKVKDLFILLNGKKVFYRSSPKPSKTLPFTATIDLKAGANLITVVARESDTVSASETYVIRSGL